jgi:DNA-binding beta-propeller fold protein YncE
MSRLVITVAALSLGYCEVAAGSQMFLYWTEYGSGKIERSDLDGSHVTDIVTGLNHPAGIAIDGTNGKIYWTTHESGNGSGTLQRANLNGSGVQTVLSGLGAPEGVAIDPTAGFAYYTDRSDPSGGPNDRGIHRVNLDGSGKTLLLSTRNGPADPSNPGRLHDKSCSE